jgi:hypothetical protein
MKPLYPVKAIAVFVFLSFVLTVRAQVPTTTGNGICTAVVANFNTNDNGFNAPSIYGGMFDSSFYFNAGRGYWTDYLPPTRTAAPGVPRVLTIISPPFPNPNPNGTFNVGFSYIVGNPLVDRFQVRIISVTETPSGTVTDVEATSGVQLFSSWSTPSPYVDGVTDPAVPDPSPFFVGSQGIVCIRLVDPDIINSPNTRFRVEVAYLISEPTFVMFDNLSIGPVNIPLPVNFIGLVANRNSSTKSIDLRWDVSEEIDVQEYQIERSTNGSSFTTTGSVAAKGKSVYSFSDNDIPSMVFYYRIKSVDIDGKYKYSGIIRLAADADNSYSTQLGIYPSPARNDVMVQHRKLNGRAKITVASLDGKILKVIVPTPGSSNTPIDISALAPGMYFLKLDDETGFSQTAKLLKN